MISTMRYYFGYGSNMSIKQMTERCPNSHYVDKAELKDWQFIYNTDHVATITENQTSLVWGAVFEISENDEQALDHFEGVAQGKYKKVELEIAPFGHVLTYIATNDTVGQPFDNYHRHIIVSAKNRNLPSDYIEQEFLSKETSGKVSKRAYVNGNE